MKGTADPPGVRTTGQRPLLIHCRRVAAVAVELAQRLGMGPREREMLADAALVHHYPPELISVQTINSALAILERQCRAEVDNGDPAIRKRRMADLLKLLTAFHSLSLNQRGDPLPGILTAANFVVDRVESPLPGSDPRDGISEALRRKTSEGLISSSAFRAYSSLPQPRGDDLLKSITRLPVFPTVALRVLALAASDQVSFRDLSELVSRDQALAVHLIGAANSCLYSPVGQISTISHAMSYIGLEETRRIITAASLRPLFASGGVAEIWKHSLETSRACEDLAALAGGVRKDEAFLAGLVHDAGRLLALRHAGEASVTFVRLLEQGCDQPFAEVCLFGCDHAALGAEVLRIWKFPEHLVDAVRHHHHPEQTAGKLASLVYLAESRDPAERAEQTAAGIEYASRITGLAQDSLQPAEQDIGLLRLISA